MITLVSTVFNDRSGLEVFFAAMAAQTRLPDEIVIVDAGSKDGTWELLQEESVRTDRKWCLVALQERGCNVARGRNLAIEKSGGALIVSTDIGCEWDAEWLAELVAPLERDSGVELVIGSWAVRSDTLRGDWAQVEWALRGDQSLVANSGSFGSSRSIAYRKSVWAGLGGYPEDLTLAADDTVFVLLYKKAGVKCAGAPVVRCYWHRHSTLRGFCKESFRYGLGDGEAGIRLFHSILIGGRMMLELLGLVGGLVCLFPGIPGAPWAGLALLGVSAASVGAKIIKMREAVGRLGKARVARPLLRLLAFTYGCKWHWLRGYSAGRRRGAKHCSDCRRRLRAMTPEFYRRNRQATSRSE